LSARRTRPRVRERIARDRLFQISADLPRIVEVDIAGIAPNPEQPRTHVTEEELEGLKASIERHGLLQPILVQRRDDGGYVLVAGQRRLAAVQALGRTTIPAILVGGDPGEVALVENLQRQDLDPFEEARAVARLMERHGYSQGEVGAVIGKKQNTVSALLALNRLPSRISEEYRSYRDISRSVLIELAQVPKERDQLDLWENVKRGVLKVRDVRDEGRILKTVSRPKPTADDTLRRFLGMGDRVLRELRTSPEAAMADRKMRARLQALHKALGEVLAGTAKDAP
jgi:ParB family transcriptional regulator, chromosome partitioning protein